MVLRRIAQRGQQGMCTAEYAFGTVVACGFACMLLRLATSWRTMLMSFLLKGFEVHFGWFPWPS